MPPEAESPRAEAADRRESAAYHLFMLALCLYALGALAAHAVLPLDPRTRAVLDYADYGVCALFLADFALSLARADDRWRYMRTWGWLDLLSSVPTVDVARLGRAGRVLRIFRVLRALRATRHLAALLLRRRAQSAFLAATLVGLLLIVFCSVAVLHFETDPGSNIRTAEDALWWAFATVTTVGYGDRFPVTQEGRVVAVMLMCVGVALFGTFSGYVASWFIAPEARAAEREADAEIAALRREMEGLRRAVEDRNARRDA